MKWNLLGFSFIVSDFSVLPKKYLPQGCKDLFPTSSSRSCRVNFALFCCMAWGKGQVSCFFPFFFLNRAIRGLLGKGDGIWKQQEEGFAWLPGPWCTWSPHLRRAEVSDKVKRNIWEGANNISVLLNPASFSKVHSERVWGGREGGDCTRWREVKSSGVQATHRGYYTEVYIKILSTEIVECIYMYISF